MNSLFWRKKARKVVAVPEVPFPSEEAFEKYIVSECRDALGDIFLLSRQVRTGHDIPDLVGVDRDNNIVIIENKNDVVDEEIVPQILRYAIWAEKNPDSIRALWLEAEDKPDDLQPDWDHVNVRVLVLAPKINVSAAHFVERLGYVVELIEVKRFQVGKEEFVLLNKLESSKEGKKRPVKGLEIYDKAFYRQHRNHKSVDLFFALAGEIEKMAKKARWNLEKKFNKYYVGFKYGFPNVFGVHWVGSKSMEIFIKAQPPNVRALLRLIPYKAQYDDRWKNLNVRIDEKTDIKRMGKAFALAYKLIEGK